MAYLGKTPSQAVRSRYYFTASGGETSLSPSEVTGLSFTDANYVDVSLNGVALVSGTDYTATPSTNTISGLAALTASDVVEIVVYDTFSVFGGNVNGDFNISGGDLTLGDNDKAIFGAGSDLQVFHDATDSHVVTTSGNLNLQVAGGGTINIGDQFGNTLLKVVDNADVKLYHGTTPSQKLATTSSGIDVTGTVTADGLTVDNAGVVRLNPSSGDDFLTIQQGGSQAVITADSAAGAGNLVFRTTSAGSDTDTMLLAANGDISFYDNTGTTQGLFWDASTQRLGLGTTSPSFPLTIENSANHLYLKQSNQDNGWLINTADADGQLHFYRRGEGASPSNNERVTISTSGNVGIGVINPVNKLVLPNQGYLAWQNSAGASETIAIRANTSDGLEFLTGSTRMTLDSSGRLGIGTSSPSTYSAGGSNLVVANSNSGANAVGMSLVNPNSAVGTSVSLEFVPNTNVALASISSPRTAANGATDLTFNTYTGSSMTEKMRIASDGTITVKGEGTNTTEVSQGLCKQWVKFDSTGTFEIDDSFNTSSVTDSGTGHAVPNVNNDFANNNYATSASCNEPFGATTIVHITTYANGSYNVLTQADSGNTRKDVDFGVATSFGDLS